MKEEAVPLGNRLSFADGSLNQSHSPRIPLIPRPLLSPRWYQIRIESP